MGRDCGVEGGVLEKGEADRPVRSRCRGPLGVLGPEGMGRGRHLGEVLRRKIHKHFSTEHSPGCSRPVGRGYYVACEGGQGGGPRYEVWG